jgi:2-deoxy-D-gluconate 3-dehydrogenase
MNCPSSSILDMFTVRGKTVIITGGTGGLGLTLALALAENGADIVSIQIPGDPAGAALKGAIEGLGRKFATFDCNIADATSIRSAFAAIWEAGTIPDILLNCAGVSRRGPIADFAEEDVDLVG